MTPSPNMFAQYLKESSGIETVEFNGGFFSYSVEDDCIHVCHLFVQKESRRADKAYEFFDLIRGAAATHQKRFVDCAVDIAGPSAKKNLLIYLRQGFELKELGRRHIFLRYDNGVNNG